MIELKTKRYKIQIIGGNTKGGKQPQAYCAIPTKWFRAHGLEKGDSLEITYSDDPEDKYFTVRIP